MKMNRLDLLQSLLKFEGDIDSISNDLTKFGWDSSEDLITFERSHALSVLERYLNNSLSETEIENWANAIEGREDVGFEKEYLQDLIHELANPFLATPLNEHFARKWILKISNSE